MLKMWILAFLTVLSIGTCQGALENCDSLDYLAVCSSNLQDKFFLAKKDGNLTSACVAIEEYVGCVEYVACGCGLTGVPSVHNQLTYIGGVYAFQNCVQLKGPLIMNKGIPCPDNSTGETVDGELLVLTTAEAETVLELDQQCSGVKDCYITYDKDAAVALHNRNLTSLCNILETTMACLENVACRCGEDAIENITTNVISNHAIYTQTCSITVPEILPKDSINCSDNGTAVTQTICDHENAIYKCYVELDDALTTADISTPVTCSAYKTYIECTEGIACDCGLIRSPNVYRAVTLAAAAYNDNTCAQETGPLEIVSGLDCPDGSGTREGEDRLIIALSEDPTVMELESICPGIKSCYSTLDDATGIALFEKNIKKLCAGQKVFIECMEDTYCQCGYYDLENTTTYLNYQRENHVSACFTDSILRDNFQCQYGSIGFHCRDNKDCQSIHDSECQSNQCSCKAGFKYMPNGHPNKCMVDTKDINLPTENGCTSLTDCLHIDGAQCDNSGFCACQFGFVLSSDKITCEPVSSASRIPSTLHGVAAIMLLIYSLL